MGRSWGGDGLGWSQSVTPKSFDGPKLHRELSFSAHAEGSRIARTGQARTPNPVRTPSVDEMNRCPKCGTAYPGDAKFCTKDGSKLSPAAAAAPAAAPVA